MSADSFPLYLYGAVNYERIDAVMSFIGEDASGSFGIQAHHARFMTVLVYGLARAQRADGVWEYLGVPGGVLYFHDNGLHLSTRRYLRDTGPARIIEELAGHLLEEEQELALTRRKLHGLEARMLQEMVELDRDTGR